jgi:hypothetical protein
MSRQSRTPWTSASSACSAGGPRALACAALLPDRVTQAAALDATLDVLDIADQLGLDEFSVVGRSGGGPHDLACAALISQKRRQRVEVLAGLAPSDASGLD